MKDRRFVRTENIIHETFLKLLKEKTLNQITVSEIARIGNLGRGTFYLHYQDIYDLYNHIEDQLYDELGKLFDEACPCNNVTNLMNLTNNILDYISINNEIFRIIIRLEGNEKTFSKLKNFFNEKVLQDSLNLSDAMKNATEYDLVEANFIVSGVAGVLEDWLNNDMIMPKENVSTILQQILAKF